MVSAARNKYSALYDGLPTTAGVVIVQIWYLDGCPERGRLPVAAKTVAMARAARSAYVAKANATTLAVIREIQHSGITTLAGVARTLEARGVKTLGGRGRWQPVQVSRLSAA